jgi:hypothetical protein
LDHLGVSPATLEAAKLAGKRALPDQAALDDRFGDHLGAFYAALGRLLRTPAPDFAALTVKIVLAVDHEIGTLTAGERCLAALKADARRLAAGRR